MTELDIRLAAPADLDAIRRIVHGSYAVYLSGMARPPAPMLDDYVRRIDDGEAFVAAHGPDIVGVLILVDGSDHLLLDNVAVDPSAQGSGTGRRLVGFAEAEAKRRGYEEIRLYTHVVMARNVAYYESLGWVETHRAEQDGYQRIFMRKRLQRAGEGA